MMKLLTLIPCSVPGTALSLCVGPSLVRLLGEQMKTQRLIYEFHKRYAQLVEHDHLYGRLQHNAYTDM